MNTILTDDERRELRSEHGWALDTIKAIEAAVLAKLREQEPVAWMQPRMPEKMRGPATRTAEAYGFVNGWNACVDAIKANAAPLPAVVQVPQGDDYIGGLEYRGNSVAYIHQKLTAYRTLIDEAWQAMRDAGQGPDGKTPLPDAIRAALAAPEAPAQGEPHRAAVKTVTDQLLTGASAGFEQHPEAPAQGGTWMLGNDAEDGAGDRLPEAPEAQPIPAPWREAVKVAREALKTYDGSRAIDQWDEHIMPSKEWDMRRWAALAHLDALEGGE